MLILTALFACAPEVATLSTLTGTLEVDLSGETPVFLSVDAGGSQETDRVTGLSVVLCDELAPDGDVGITALRVWDIETTDGLPEAVSYGDVPAGAKEVVSARALAAGAWYAAELDADGTSQDAWTVTFQPDDPESLIPGRWCQEAPLD